MMNLYELIAIFEKSGDSERAIAMKKYQRNQFEFLGISAPRRAELWKEYFKVAKKTKSVDWGFVNKCWDSRYREIHYIAAYYLKSMANFLELEDIEKIKAIAVRNSWWDTIDILDRTVGNIVARYPDAKTTMLEWSTCDNIWLRRIAIDHQLLRKEKTDTELLEKILMNNFGTTEFFINKAIGWALRDYSKANPQWVRDFIATHKESMSNLSIREGSKYI